MEPRNRFQGMNSASLCSLAGRYDNPIPPRFLAPIDSLKIPAQVQTGKVCKQNAIQLRSQQILNPCCTYSLTLTLTVLSYSNHLVPARNEPKCSPEKC
jgi:hypothetical protein